MKPDEFEQLLASEQALTRNQIGELLAELLPEDLPPMLQAGALLAINNLPKAALPELSRIFRQGVQVAREQGPEAFCNYLQGLGCPPPLVELVRKRAEQQP